MSRSNHHYYNICSAPLGADGYCEWHEPKAHWLRHKTCTSERDVVTRRGVYRRHRRFPKWSIKSWHSGPPMELKKRWHRRARAQQKQEFLQNPDDPLITPIKRLIDLWNWY